MFYEKDRNKCVPISKIYEQSINNMIACNNDDDE